MLKSTNFGSVKSLINVVKLVFLFRQVYAAQLLDCKSSILAFPGSSSRIYLAVGCLKEFTGIGYSICEGVDKHFVAACYKQYCS